MCDITGVCNNATQFACTAGTSSANNAGSCGWSSTWSCLGSGNGTNASCSKANAACAPICNSYVGCANIISATRYLDGNSGGYWSWDIIPPDYINTFVATNNGYKLRFSSDPLTTAQQICIGQ